MDRIVFEHTLSLFWFLLPSHSSVQLVHSIVPIIHYFFQKKKKKLMQQELNNLIFHLLVGVTLQKLN